MLVAAVGLKRIFFGLQIGLDRKKQAGRGNSGNNRAQIAEIAKHVGGDNGGKIRVRIVQICQNIGYTQIEQHDLVLRRENDKDVAGCIISAA